MNASLRSVRMLGVGVVTAGALCLTFLPSCYDRRCEGSFQFYGAQAGEGTFVDSDTWQTGPNAGGWLPYPAQRTYGLIAPGVTGPGGRRLKYSLVYVSPAVDPNRIPDPGQLGDEYTLASGNVAEVTYRTDAVFIHNDTCASYFVRVVLVLEGPDADGGTDAMTDAPFDAASPDTGSD